MTRGRDNHNAWPYFILSVDDFVLRSLFIHPLYKCVSGLGNSLVLQGLRKDWRPWKQSIAPTMVKVEMTVYYDVHILYLEVVTSEKVG